MKRFLLFTAALLMSVYTMGQSTANYTFATNTTGSLGLDMNGNTIDMTTGTTPLVGASSDQGVSPLTNIGFNFILMGTPFTQFSVSANGVMQLGTTLVGSTTYVASGGSATSPRIAAIAADMATTATGSVTGKVVGTAPNRCLVIQFTDIALYWGNTTADGTFQVRLYETTGVIEFVYGKMIVGATTYSSNYTTGFSTNTTANNLACITTSTNTSSTASFTTNAYPASTPIVNLNSSSEGSRRIYRFTPPAAPAAPSWAATPFTAINAVGMTLNWVDNSTTEYGFGIYRSTDGGANYTYITTTAANATSYAATGLNPSTTYTWMVYAMGEAGSNASPSNTQATLAPSAISSTGTGGNWSNPATWVGGSVPSIADTAVISDGTTVIIDVTASCAKLKVGGGTSGILRFGTTAVTLTVTGSVIIATGGTFDAGATGGASLSHTLNIGGTTAASTTNGSILNNGTFDMYIGASNGKTTVVFYGIPDASVSGTGTFDFNTVTLNKGAVTATASVTPPVLDIQSAFTVQGANTVGLIGTHTAGVLKISGSFTLSTPLYVTAGYTIPVIGGLWLNNASFTATGQAGSPTLAGLLKMTAGTLTIGTTNNSMGFSSGSVILIDGGIINAVARFGVTSASNTPIYNQTGGIVYVNSSGGNASSTLASFDMGTGTTSSTSFTMSGGTIVLCKGSANTEFRGPATGATINITGGTLQLGTAAVTTPSITITPASTTFRIIGSTPNLVVNSSNNPGVLLTGTTNVFGDLTINGTGTFSLGTLYQLNMKGNSATYPGNITNAGTFNANAGSTQELVFNSSFGNQTFTNTGTVTNNAITKLTINNTFTGGIVTLPGSLAIKDPSASLSGTLTLTKGILTATGLTFGGGSTGGFNLIRGDGSLTNAPTFSFGTGAVNYTYNGTVATTTGVELPTSISGTLTINNAAGVILNANLITTGGLTLTSGVLSGTNTLTIGGGAALGFTMTRSSGSVSAPITFALGSGTNAWIYNAPTPAAAYSTGNELPATGVSTLTINNSSGISLDKTLAVSTTMTMTSGNLTIGNYNLTLGISAATAGTLTYTAGSIVTTGGTFTRWFPTTGLPTSLGTSIGYFPMSVLQGGLVVNREVKIAFSSATALTTGGTITCGVAEAAGLTSGLSVLDGTYTINRRTNSSWTLSQSNLVLGASATILMRALGTSAFYTTSYANVHLMKANAVAGGTHSAGTGSNAAPAANRTGLVVADLSNTFYIGGANADMMGYIVSAASGDWNNGANWVGGVAPTSSDAAVILNTHTITVSDAQAAQTVTINTGGTLTVSAGSLAISSILTNNGTFNANGGTTTITGGSATGITNAATTGFFTVNGGTVTLGPVGGGNTTFANSGTLTVSSGTLNINGNFANTLSTGNVFTQSGGNINVDGNAGGVAANSVAAATNIVNFASGSPTTLLLTGGTFTIVDPPAPGATAYALNGGVSPATNCGLGHTFAFGNGTSSDAGGSNGFYVYLWPSSYLVLGNVIVNGPSGINRHVNLTSYVGFLGNLTINSGGELRTSSTSNYIGGNITVNSGGILTNANTITLANFSGGSAVASTVPQTISGAGAFRNSIPSATIGSGGSGYVVGDILTVTGGTYSSQAQFIVSAVTSGAVTSVLPYNYANYSVLPTTPAATTTGGSGSGCTLATLTNLSPTANTSSLSINNTNSTGVTLGLPLSISGTLTLTSGIVNTTATNLLRLGTATAAGTLSGSGSATAFINGPFARTFANGRTASGTYDVTTLFPVGKNGSPAVYAPIWIDPVTGSLPAPDAAVILTGEAFMTNPGSAGAGVTNLSQHRWEALNSNASKNFTSAYVQITDGGILAGQQILHASTASDVYGGIPVATTTAVGTLKTAAPISGSDWKGYYAYGNLVSCDPPTAQPTNFAASFKTSTGFIGSFTAASPAPSHYLVVRYASGATATAPLNYTTYAAGGTLGTGTIVAASALTTFTETALTAGTTYDYYIYSYNNVGCYGPVYFTTSPLFASVTLCAAAIGTPGTPTASLVTNSSFTASWTASSTAGVSYILDVATNASFTSFVPGFNGLDVGVGTLTYPIPGLSANTTYYVRVRAISGGACYSVYSGTLTQTTECNAATLPTANESFESASLPVCWSTSLVSGSYNWASTTSNDGVPSAHTGTYFMGKYYSSSDALIFSQPIDMTTSAVGALMNVWIYRSTVNYSSDRIRFHINTTKSLTGATQLLEIFPLTTVSPVVASSGWYNYEVAIPASYNSATVAYIIAQGTTTGGTSSYGLGFDDFKVIKPVVPTVTTTVATAITGATAESGGNVTATGGSAVTGRGLCWSTTADPTIADSHTSNGTGTGTFNSSMSDLLPNTTYHYRAYATNAVGTAYGADLQLTTLNVFAPSVTTSAVSSVTDVTATANGSLVDDGGSGPVTESGFVYSSTNNNPTVGGTGVTKVIVGSGTVDPGDYSVGLTGLTKGTLYYVKAYAINNVGIGYGTVINFTTVGVTTTAATAIGPYAATSGGNITSDGGNAITARGVCFGLTANPDLTGSFTTDGTGTGTFVSSLILPTASTQYHYRAYATNSQGTFYGSDLTFTTLCDPGTITGTTPATRCGTGTVSLAATASSGSTVSWYSAATGGTYLGSGPAYTTPSISTTTNYYVAPETTTPASVAVGAGATSSSSYPNPFYSLWSNSHTQYLITAAELTAAGLRAGNITSVALNVTSPGTLPMIDLSVKIGSTAATSMAAFVASGSFATVYTNASMMPVSGSNVLAFSTPFTWDGTSNIILEFCHGNGSSSSTMSRTVKTDVTSYVSCVKAHVSSATSAATVCANTSSNLATYSERPQFTFAGTSACSGPRTIVVATVNTPPAVTAAATPSTPVCAGTTVNLDASSANTGYTYAWSPGTTPSTGSSVAITGLSSSTYTVTATDNSGGANNGCWTTASVSVTVNPVPSSVTASATPNAVCNATMPFNLSSSSVSNYNTPSVLLTEGFETWPPTGWTMINAGYGNSWGSSTTYHSGAKSMAYEYNSTYSANAWALTPGQALTAGVTCTVKFWYKTSYGSLYPERLKVTAGTAATVAAQTTVLWDNNGGSNLTNETWAEGTALFTPATTGTYYFGFNCYSSYDEDYLYVDDVTITGSVPVPSTYTWTSVPAGFTSAEQNPTGVTQSETTQYIVTALNGYGCSATASTTVQTVSTASIATQPQAVTKCAGQTATFTVSATGPGLTYQWRKGGTNIDIVANPSAATDHLTLANISASDAANYDVVVAASCGSPVTSDAVALTVNALPPVAVVPNHGLICNPGGSAVSLTASGASTYTWSPVTGLTPSTGETVSALPAVTTTYTVTGTDGNGCSNTATSVITVGSVFVATASATPSTICTGTNSQLLAITPAPVSPTPSLYTFAGSSGTYTPITGTDVGSGVIGDDVAVGNLPIGFTFNYNGSDHTIFRAWSNGLIELDKTANATYGYATNALASTVNCIAPLWDDNNTTGGSVIYATTGVAGSQVLTVQWTGMHVAGSGSSTNPTIDMQLRLYEGTNAIEFTYGPTSAALSSPSASIGISGASGNFLSVTPLSPPSTSTVSKVTENNTINSATNFPSGTIYTFAPPAAPTYTYAWSPATFIAGQTTLQNPVATAVTVTTPYTVTVTANTGCTSTANTTVTVVSGITIATQPTPKTGCVGQTVKFIVAAVGADLTYQWKKDGFDIDPVANPSAINDTLTLTNLAVTDAGNYSVVISSATCGTPVTSDAVALIVNPVPTATASSNSPVCSAYDINLTGTTDFGTTFSWTGPNGFTSTAQNPVVTAATMAAAGDYVLTASAGGCSSVISTTTVVMNLSPSAITITPASASVLPGAIQQLTGSGGAVSGITILSENFNDATNTFTTTNNSSGGTPSAAAWTLQPDGYTYGIYTVYTFHSNDNSQFYLSNSDAQGSSSTTATILRSPAFSTVGFTSADIKFYHYYYHINSTAKVEASTDGTTWTTLQTYSATTGSSTAFVSATVALTAPFLNKPVVYVRFKYDATWGFYWAIDNVSISGTGSAGMTWSPTANLYTDAAATVPYTGTQVSTVYSKPSTTITYTASVTASNLCVASKNVTLNVFPTVTTAPVTQVTTSTVVTGGNVTADAGTAVTERGVCWALTANPTTADNKVADAGTGTGSFISNLTLPTPGTYYHVRAYAINSAGTAYGEDVLFMTLCLPTAAPFTEDFEGAAFPPTCWSKTNNPTWIRSTVSGYGTGSGSAEANFFNISDGTPFDLMTLNFDATGLSTPTLEFDHAYAGNDLGGGGAVYDDLQIFTSSDHGLTYALLIDLPGDGVLNTGGISASEFVPTSSQWATKSYPLPAGTNMVKFQAISSFGNNLYLDNVKVYSPVTAKTLNLSVFLEGLYDNGGLMRKAQDENGDHFTGTIADQITVELHNTTNYATVEYSAGLVDLHTNGAATVSIPSAWSGSYYLTIKHRNSIEITSSLPVDFSGSTITYDFASDPANTYGDNLKLMGEGVYGIYVGDVNQDGIIDLDDLVSMDPDIIIGNIGYLPSDLNGDGIIDLDDLVKGDPNFIVGIAVATP